MNSARSAAFRRTLMKRRSRLLNQVAQIESDLGWLQTNVEPELLEEGQEQALANVLEHLDEHDRAELEAIDRALERIRLGRYGTCEMYGEAIALARQFAVPTAVPVPAVRGESGGVGGDVRLASHGRTG